MFPLLAHPADVQRAADELRGAGCEVLGLMCDVTSRDDVDKFIGTVAERWQQIDVLVNNAGIIQTGPIESMTLEDFRSSIDTHFWGPVYATRAALPFSAAHACTDCQYRLNWRKNERATHAAIQCGQIYLSAFRRTANRARKTRCTSNDSMSGFVRTGSPRNARF